jgi:hypothetical protein
MYENCLLRDEQKQKRQVKPGIPGLALPHFRA